jgi:hypothetical protein
MMGNLSFFLGGKSASDGLKRIPKPRGGASGSQICDDDGMIEPRGKLRRGETENY